MPSWLQAMLQANQGNSVPSWMKPPPSGSSGWPFNYPGSGGSQATTGTSLIPRPTSMPTTTGNGGLPMSQATPGLPATTGGQAPPAVTGGATPPATLGGGSLSDLLSGAGGAAGSLAGGARGGLAGILATLLGKTVQPQPTNSNEVPFYTMQNGRMAPNPAAASTGQLPSPANTPQPSNGIQPANNMMQPVSGVAKAPAPVTAGAPLSLAPPNPGSFLQPATPQGPAPPSNGLDNTMLGLNASQTSNPTTGFGAPAAAQSPMAKLMAMLQTNGNAAAMTGGSNSF